jgi:hypothetical protein
MRISVLSTNYIYTYEYHSVCHLVQIGTPPSRKRVCTAPRNPKGGTQSPAGGGGSPNSDDWRKSLALYSVVLSHDNITSSTIHNCNVIIDVNQKATDTLKVPFQFKVNDPTFVMYFNSVSYLYLFCIHSKYKCMYTIQYFRTYISSRPG